MNEKTHYVLLTMEKYGGAFVKALAEAFRRADPHNFRRLKEAFPELWERYTKMTLDFALEEAPR